MGLGLVARTNKKKGDRLSVQMYLRLCQGVISWYLIVDDPKLKNHITFTRKIYLNFQKLSFYWFYFWVSLHVIRFAISLALGIDGIDGFMIFFVSIFMIFMFTLELAIQMKERIGRELSRICHVEIENAGAFSMSEILNA